MGPRKKRRYNAALFTHSPEFAPSRSSQDALSTATLLKAGGGLFDKFPNELLEEIFILSGSITLARISHSLGARLSNEYVYRKLFHSVFCYMSGPAVKDWQPGKSLAAYKDRLQVFATTRNAPPLDSTSLGIAQNEVLKCRWLSYELWTQLMEEAVDAVKPKLRTYFPAESDYISYCAEGLKPVLGKHCFIPGRLLVWPDVREMNDFVGDLFDNGARIDWINTLDGETARASQRNAIEIEDIKLFVLLAKVTRASRTDVSYICDLFHFSTRSFFQHVMSKIEGDNEYKIDWSTHKLWQAADARQRSRSLATSDWPMQELQIRANE